MNLNTVEKTFTVCFCTTDIVILNVGLIYIEEVKEVTAIHRSF